MLLLALWGCMYIFPRGAGNLPPQEMLQRGLEQTMSSASFRYQAETRLTAEGRANVDFFSQVEGERVAPDQVQIIGTIMNTPIEFIQVGDCSYFRDQPTGQWVALPGNKLADSEIFYAELNPLAYFNFKDVPELKYKGIEKVNGEKLLLMEMRPNLMDPLLELRLTDFFFRVWLSPEDYRLRQAVVQAKDKHNPNSGVEINLSFWDYDKSITIMPPDVNQ
ncbi:MAG: hypothetical protein A4E53_04514 [Pelotomaculum sp. PtaB.Bin104]|nr:MAG: hypothetical protein A4E53_04514 [Pelotomaculum sp. PtaB.Bin104]